MCIVFLHVVDSFYLIQHLIGTIAHQYRRELVLPSSPAPFLSSSLRREPRTTRLLLWQDSDRFPPWPGGSSPRNGALVLGLPALLPHEPVRTRPASEDFFLPSECT